MSCLLVACTTVELVGPHLLPLSKDTLMLLGKKGMDPQAPIFIRIFKEESELELWKLKSDGRFYHLKTYPICNWSGELGPKLKEGDRQAPEGFYTISREQMNPDSKYHLAMNLGYPNAFDKAHGRTGEFLMIHGRCKSAGCYAMTDALIEEIYGIARESFLGGNDTFEVHAFPFRMTEANMARYAKHPAMAFWRTIKEGYDYFELTRQLPTVAVCERHYVVNVAMRGDVKQLDPAAACPAFRRPKPNLFRPAGNDEVTVPAPKPRAVGGTEAKPRSGLTTGAVGANAAPPP
ncbi:MAG TPA: murein L,D-transpeptidase family protein [Hyphomicrobiaceae bacterium]|nr:murein L,D-transpeptidase family protein [Hyphomicrobiaceae bacterium]